ncbi:MAG: DNA-dependent DNA polymerase [Bdellovibrionia bacterium]
MTNESLYTIFFNRLSETHCLHESAAEFIQRVTREYMLQLLEKALIPFEFMEEVLEEIEAEVLEMYRKKTYGFLTLEEFRKHHFSDLIKTE